ncbi:flagellar protein FlaG [Neomoorella thermoacetica]|uniref:flagellar protein FlaG n=1 Tax=Neomoorella thermoacetica TaxID=1525 RepID=UPI0008FB5DC0|nr:flagellar protein FlaG [Moorella thermoacetica]OIQ60538.1 flagellar protein FlaG [Moorella thermoacetica]
MRVEGVDPLVLNQVQNQTAGFQVQESKGIKINTERKQQQEERQQPGEKQLEKSVEQLNKAADAFNIELRFKVDRENNELYVYVVDVNEGKIIRRIPPENVMEVASRMQQMVGLILDTLI